MSQSVPAWFKGAIDLHVHSSPSIFPRLFDDLELAQRAAEAGMAGVVLKAHEDVTVSRARLVGQQVPNVQVYGGIVLNHFVGGFNPYAVEVALELGAKVVWMPTMHAANHIAYYGEAGYREQKSNLRLRMPEPLTVLDTRGQLKGAVGEILELIAARGDIILSNGHLNADETEALFREAKAQGIERLLVAHPYLHLTNFDLGTQRRFAALGATIEHCYLPHLAAWGNVPIERVAESVRSLGAEHCVLSTDLGQTSSLPPAQGLQVFGEALMACGVAEERVSRMLVQNPRHLLA